MLLEYFINFFKKLETQTTKVTRYFENRAWARKFSFLLFNTKSLETICPKYAIIRLTLTATIITVVGSIYGSYMFARPGWAFQEGKPMTLFSFVLLIAVGYIHSQIWQVNKKSPIPNPQHSSTAWWLFSWGFYIAAWDEMLRLHETLDRQIHHLFGVKPTHITDHLDDVFVACYGIVGLYIIWHYRKEIMRFWRTWPYFIAAALIGTLHLIFDVLSADKPFLNIFFHTQDEMARAIVILDFIEECLKCLAEIFFVGLTVAIYKKSKNEPAYV